MAAWKPLLLSRPRLGGRKPDLRASLDVVAGRDATYADTDPLEHFGFYNLDPSTD